MIKHSEQAQRQPSPLTAQIIIIIIIIIPVAAYPMNVCQFSKGELMELDQVVKRELRSRNMLGRQGSDERLP